MKSNTTILIEDDDGVFYREGYFYFPHAPTVGSIIGIVPRGENIRNLEVLKVEYMLDPESRVAMTELMCKEFTRFFDPEGDEG